MATFTPKKTPCPVSRKQFRAAAKPMLAVVGDQKLAVNAKEFKPGKGAQRGSLGFYGNGIMTVIVDGIPCKATVTVCVTLANSKEVE